MNEKPGAGRNPFPQEPFVCVPLKLFECGLARKLKPSEFKRYVTLLRCANYHKRLSFRATLGELEKLDGISSRRAHEIHPRLEEHRMLVVERDTNPYTYAVLLPSEWRDGRTGQPYPASKIPRSYFRVP
jgi:hypothetical protein